MLPCIVQIGFAGSRQLLGTSSGLPDRPQFAGELVKKLVAAIEGLPTHLGLQGHHRLCGISQMAVGGDMLFASVCAALSIPVRVFLPQPRDAYLNASDSQGGSDFSDSERAEAVRILDSDTIIQEMVVSNEVTRGARFEQCNEEIVQESDALVCLFGVDARARSGAGGTNDMMEQAIRRGIPVLELRLRIQGVGIELDQIWHVVKDYTPPSLPEPLRDLRLGAEGSASYLPSIADYCISLKTLASEQSRFYTKKFKLAALWIIGTHVFATFLAALALALHSERPETARTILLLVLLATEAFLLVGGFLKHRWFHHHQPSGAWAFRRLLAEIVRSISSLGDFQTYPKYLFWLRLPPTLRPLLRTLSVLHLCSTRPLVGKTRIEDSRMFYAERRIAHQIEYYAKGCRSDGRWLRISSTVFVVCSLAAICATMTKLGLTIRGTVCSTTEDSVITSALGVLAISLPTFAVGALSWAAARDYRSRKEAFQVMLRFLGIQQRRTNDVTSIRGLSRLIEETEFNLLGEVADWYTRRTAAEVA